MSKQAHTLVTLLLLGACGPSEDQEGFGGSDLDLDTDTDTDTTPDTLVWDDEAPEIDCGDPATADLLAEALDDADLTYTDLGYDTTEWGETSFYAYLDDNFLLEAYREALFQPQTIACRSAQFGSDLDFAMDNRHPVASAIGEAMDLADIPRVLEPVQANQAAAQTLADMIGVPSALKSAMQPILAAMDDAVYQWTYTSAYAPAGVHPFEMCDDGYSELVYGGASDPLDLSVGPSQIFIVDDDGPRAFWDQARRLAYAIEEANLAEFFGTQAFLDMNVEYVGRIVITGPGDDEWPDRGPVALWVDLGGDDVYLHPVAATDAADNDEDSVPIAIHIDIGGNDTYTYEPSDEGEYIDLSVSHWDLLPSDAAGRYPENSYYGPISASNQGRQGSGRYGIGMLFDLGGNDTYMSPRLSQGYAHLGVGVLYDAEGDDVYLAEEGAQGAGINGLGLLLDVEGNDIYRSYTLSQGFNFLTGVGAAWDGDGDDTWYTNPGTLDRDGRAMYFSSDIPFEGNQSYSQGASLGLVATYTYTFLSGGVGMLRDQKGDDVYTSSARGQGYGFWQTSGYLVDGDGHDTYNMGAMGQGTGFYYSTGVLLDDGDGDDRFNEELDGTYLLMGGAYEYSAGIFVNEAGNDYYRWPTYGGSWSTCSGVAMFADNDGQDSYEADGEGGGFAEEFCSRSTETLALFMDSGGDNDEYDGEWGSRDPGDNTLFGGTSGAASNEHGGAVDGDGETGLHAGGL